jgi:hypothetical protein
MIQVQTNIAVNPETKKIDFNVWIFEREDANDHERKQAKNIESILAKIYLSAAKHAGYELEDVRFYDKRDGEVK